MEFTYQHSLTKGEAYNRLNNLLFNLQKQYWELSNAKINWNPERTHMEFSVDIMRFNLNGQVYLRDNEITLKSELPLFARMFSKNIEHHLKLTLEDILSDSKRTP